MKITGHEGVMRNIQAVADSITRATMEKGLHQAAEHYRTHVIRNLASAVYGSAPSPHYVRTGLLKESPTEAYSEARPNSIEIGLPMDRMNATSRTPVGEYGPYVEFGTRHMPARPAWRPAISSAAPGVVKLLSETIWHGMKVSVTITPGGGA